MNTRDVMKMVQMRKDGYTYKEIGELYGVSKQYIWQTIGTVQRFELDKIKRVRLRKFFEETGISINKFTTMVYGYSNSVNSQNMTRFLQGSDLRCTIRQMIKMCEITGLKLQELSEV